MPVIGPSFAISGIEPGDVRRAPVPDRQAFWEAVSEFVADAKQAELAAGLDRFGSPMTPIAESTRKHRKSAMGTADPNAPPLTPAYGASRTRSLFTAEPNPGLNGVDCYWEDDSETGDSWGVILGYHRDGNDRLPVRDVFGLSPKSLSMITRRSALWWAGYLQGQSPTGGTPAGLWPLPKISPQPTYQPNNAANAIPKNPKKITQLNVNGHVYTLQSGTAAQIKRSVKNGTFSGWGRVTPLPNTGSIWIKPNPAVPAPRIVPPPLPPAKLIPPYTVAGSPPQSAINDYEQRLQELAPGVQSALSDAGVTHVFAEKLTDKFPDLKGIAPRGWTEGTWDNSEGLADWVSKEIVTARTAKQVGGLFAEPSSRTRGVFFHETGHGLDLALGTNPIQGFQFSAQKEFMSAYKADVADLDVADKIDLAYYLQENQAGPEEVFAELFANTHGEMTHHELIEGWFPRTAAVIARKLESLK